MSYSKERFERAKRLKQKRYKRFVSTYTTLITLFVVSGIALIYSILYLYGTTKEWTNTNQGIKMSELAPEYVTNVPNTALKDTRELSSELNSVLADIENKHQIPRNAEGVVNKINDYLSKNNITSGSLHEGAGRLDIYIKTDAILQSYKNDVNTDRFNEAYRGLSEFVLKYNRDIDKYYLDKLQGVIGYYSGLSDVLQNTLPTYASIDGSTLVINSDVTDLSTFLGSLEPYKETPQIGRLYTDLSKNRQQIENNNKTYLAKVDYDRFKDLLKKMDGIYVQVSTLKTVDDVVKNGWKVNGDHKGEDKILSVWYNGSEIKQTDWVKLGAKLHFVVEERVTLPTNESERISEHQDISPVIRNP